ncbi:MAG TPA: DUF4214 domain-containing protein, partial [Pyrinomonadaceae bacterium]|nr:DUF4214 domain-containing protein [Pyrinomonadaceae bacterium]
TFLNGLPGVVGTVRAVALQPNGDILIGGAFSFVNGQPRQGVARLNADGSLDASFLASGSGANHIVTSLAVQPDGKVLVGGIFTSFAGQPRNRVARLNADGSLDASFANPSTDPGAGANSTVQTITRQPDGKVLIGGVFTAVGGVARGRLARLNADGSLDETFLNFTSGADDTVNAVTLQPDGKVLVAGNFTSVNGVVRPGVARLTVALSPNPIDAVPNFVTQHYRDFFNREPDAAGLAFWADQITSCGANQACRELRTLNVSAAFFLSIEFQQTGFIVYKTYGAAFGTRRVGSTVPLTFQEFLPDLRTIGEGVIVGQGNWEQRIEQNKQAYFNAFVARPQFVAAYPASMSAAQFVDKLHANSGNSLSASDRDALVAALTSGQMTRAQVLRAVAENSNFSARERNRAFVLMQYFGYLRRNPYDPPEPTLDFAGFNFWLGKLEEFDGDFVAAEMVKAFITSGEYRDRFGR